MHQDDAAGQEAARKQQRADKVVSMELRTRRKPPAKKKSKRVARKGKDDDADFVPERVVVS